jgi:hypothetical protein
MRRTMRRTMRRRRRRRRHRPVELVPVCNESKTMLPVIALGQALQPGSSIGPRSVV